MDNGELDRAYDDWLEVVKGILRIRIRRMTADDGTKDLANAFLRRVSDVLDQARPDIAAAIGKLEQEHEGVADAFAAELAFYNRRYGRYGQLDDRNGVDDDRVDPVWDAKTVKDSLEELLGRWLPDWVKKALKLLNELMSLV